MLAGKTFSSASAELTGVTARHSAAKSKNVWTRGLPIGHSTAFIVWELVADLTQSRKAAKDRKEIRPLEPDSEFKSLCEALRLCGFASDSQGELLTLNKSRSSYGQLKRLARHGEFVAGDFGRCFKFQIVFSGAYVGGNVDFKLRLVLRVGDEAASGQ